ncbi:MAG: hypothetical protein KZQ89_19230 [Candidatus Thiodiazotropha sp. (ex Lucinoma kastoroae)]|nr:hypothetical protein [Candidatus Thiodiazotropha sp. (ex Lucinoma kastoroae)]
MLYFLSLKKAIFILILTSIYTYGGIVSAQKTTTQTSLEHVYIFGNFKPYNAQAKRYIEDRKIRALKPIAGAFMYIYTIWRNKTLPYRGTIRKMTMLNSRGSQKRYLVKLDASLQHQNESAHMDIYNMRGKPKGKLKTKYRIDQNNNRIYSVWTDWNDNNFPKLKL